MLAFLEYFCYSRSVFPAGCCRLKPVILITAFRVLRYGLIGKRNFLLFLIWAACVGTLHAATAPVISVQPTNKTVLGGSHVSFYVGATADPPPTYAWFLNGAPVPGQSNASLDIPAGQTVHQGLYHALVSNEVGVATSDAAELLVLTNAPTIVEQPTNFTVRIGQSASFSVIATGLPPPQYQWRFNGQDIRGRILSLLSFAAQETNAGEYSVVVSNSVGSVTSEVARLTVSAEPRITVQPTNVAVIEGQDARLISAVTGGAPLLRQWYRDGLAVAGATNDRLWLRQIRLADAGPYYFVASNHLGYATSAIATVSVAMAPRHPGAIDIDYYTGTNSIAGFNLAAFDSQGRVLAAVASGRIVRVQQDGRIDPTFEYSQSDPLYAIAVQPDDSVVVGGSFGSRPLFRLKPNGQMDTNFVPGFNFFGQVRSVGMLSDGRIVASGFSSSTIRTYNVVRAFHSTGAYDRAFKFGADFDEVVGGGGSVPLGEASSPQTMLVNAKDELTIIETPRLLRLRSDGSPIVPFFSLSRFGPVGALAPDGALYLGGTTAYTNSAGLYRRYVLRVQPGAEVDPSFELDRSLTNRISEVSALAVQTDGRIVVAAREPGPGGWIFILRLHPNGQIDSSFAEARLSGGGVRSLLIQRDGRIVVAGSISSLNGYARNGLLRLLGDSPAAPVITKHPEDLTLSEGQRGSLSAAVSLSEPTTLQWYRGGQPVSSGTNVILHLRSVVLNDAGDYWLVASNSFGTATSAVARVAVDSAPTFPGAVDLSFDANCNGRVHSIVPTPDGKFIIGGRFSSVGNQPRRWVARLHGDGSLDDSFDAGPGPVTYIYENGEEPRIDRVAVAADGKIYVAGKFMFFNGLERRNLVRLQTNGVVDPSFVPAGFFSRVSAVVPVADGKLLVLGEGDLLKRMNPDGSIDQTFWRTTQPSLYGGANYDIVVAPDGKIIVPNAPRAVLRLHPDGRLDTSFSTEHFVYYLPAPMYLRGDGHLLVGGRPPGTPGPINGFLYRLGPDGRKACAIGPCFDLRSGEVNWLGGDACDRILVGGRFQSMPSNSPPYFARLSPTGQADPEFTLPLLNGPVLTGLSLPDGRILIGGEFTEVAGVPRNRIAILHGGPYSPPSITRQPESQLLDEGHPLSLAINSPCGQPATTLQWYRDGTPVAGQTNATLNIDTALVGHTGNYTIVLSNALGVVTSGTAQVTVNLASRDPGAPAVERATLLPSNAVVRALLAMPDGKLLVGGSFSNFLGQSEVALFRLDADGRVDPGFVHVGSSVSTLALQRDGKVLVVGTTTFPQSTATYPLLWRIWPDGSRDTNFARPAGGYILPPRPDDRFAYALSMNDAGDIWISESRQIRRMHDNLTKEVNGAVYAMAFQPDGKLLVGGAFTSLAAGGGADVALTNLARLLPNGDIDTSFFPSAGTIYAIALQPDGRVVAGGQFSSAGGKVSRGVARFNADGSVDETFGPNPGVLGTDTAVYALLLQPDGRIVVGGHFSGYNGQPRNGLARLNPDGSLDETFAPGTGISGGAAEVTDLAMTADGSLYLGGSFTHFNGVPRLNFAAAYNNPLLYQLEVEGGALRLSFRSQYGLNYRLQSRTHEDAPWVTVDSVTGDSTLKILSNDTAGDTMRFYRLRIE